MSASRQAAASVRWSGKVTGPRHGSLPTREGRLFLKLRSNREQQDTILTRHVPDLNRRLGSLLKGCWFIRYDHPGEHLRLRLALSTQASGTAIEQVGAWSDVLQDAGLINSVSWETYYPETARFGGATALAAAEDFFTADSGAAIAQLTACTAKNGPDIRALTAASLVDIAVSLIGDDAAAMHWLVKHTVTDPTPPSRALYKQAVAIASSRNLGSAVASEIEVNVSDTWEKRRTALASYRNVLRRAGTVKPEELLPDLLHLHHARMAGPDIAAERSCLHLARAAALSRIARARKTLL